MVQLLSLSLAEFKAEYANLVVQHLGLTADQIRGVGKLENLLNALNPHLHAIVEYPYVDKLHRDSYYHFFAAGHHALNRDCIRVSLFGEKVEEDDFFDKKKHEHIKENYRGFFVLRAVSKGILGRSIVAPQAFKSYNFVCSLVKFKSSLLGLPLEVHAFPHSTQDTFMISCAETSIWATMEFFGNRYPEYSVVMPNRIHRILQRTYTQRPLPSNGLTAIQISTALQELGFSPRLYSVDGEKSNEGMIFSTISDYVESGIPVILAIMGEKIGGHAILVIGHEVVTNPAMLKDADASKDAVELRAKYLAIDDNRPPYQFITLSDPLAAYSDAKYRGAKIISVIVPLYQRMSIDAQTAKKLFDEVHQIAAANETDALPKPTFTRRFLTSTKSYKRWLSDKPSMNEELRRVLMQATFPRFIWVAEYSKQYGNASVESMIIIDASGLGGFDSLLFVGGRKKCYLLDNPSRNRTTLEFGIGKVDPYQNNLKGAWNEWQSH